jgi:hypothetical protein
MFFMARASRYVIAGIAVAAATSLIPSAAAAAAAAPAIRAAAGDRGGGPLPADPFSPAYRHSYRHGVIPTLTQYGKMLRWVNAHRSNAANTRNLAWWGGWDGLGVTTGHEKVYLVSTGRSGAGRAGTATGT